MRETHPRVYLISRPSMDWGEVASYLANVDLAAGVDNVASQWINHTLSDSEGECLVEFGGRLCYRSWAPELNPNVTRVRQGSADYLANLLKQAHGSVMEHANYSFVFHNVSRVFTHELVRHRAGVAISQESMRYVRLTDIPLWMPQWAREDPELVEKTHGLVETMQELQTWMGEHFGLDDEGVPFSEKKHKTSFMRRFAPDGVSTGMLWTANLRTLRWVTQLRTDPSAEEEIRLVFDAVARVMAEETPHLFADFEQAPVDGTDIPAWIPNHRKV